MKTATMAKSFHQGGSAVNERALSLVTKRITAVRKVSACDYVLLHTCTVPRSIEDTESRGFVNRIVLQIASLQNIHRRADIYRAKQD